MSTHVCTSLELQNIGRNRISGVFFNTPLPVFRLFSGFSFILWREGHIGKDKVVQIVPLLENFL